MNEVLVSNMKRALRRLAKSVTIIACEHGGKRFAITATAVAEVSLDPPSMLVCVNQRSSIYPALEMGCHFSINILHRSQSDIASVCGGSANGEDRFTYGRWTVADNNIPWLADSQASMLCRDVRAQAFGTHGIIIGHVFESYVAEAVEPLIYFDGSYAIAQRLEHIDSGEVAPKAS
jgi:flavin reductase (DIM6/NTAB) family NADH-FMN oxidoreductase RutF